MRQPNEEDAVTTPTPSASYSTADPVLLVSGDSHVGPLLETQLREYCPTRYRDEFDEFARSPFVAANRAALGGGSRVNSKTAGHYDVDARLADMDSDGIAAELIFHDSFNGEPFPLRDGGWPDPADPELAAVGFQIYNRWLADFCAAAPERLIGLPHLPMWDLDAAISELRWAADHGFRGVNFPGTRPGWPHYNEPVWEPFWSAAENAGMVLTTHAGGGVDPAATEVFAAAAALMLIEAGGTLNRRVIPRMIIGGVFERHPGLKVVMTEQPGVWVPNLLTEMDSAVLSLPQRQGGRPLPKPPSEYFMTNIFVGASFMSPLEAESAVRDGYWANLFWGRDYPHPEGTWKYSEDRAAEPMTHLSLRHAFAGIPEDKVRALVGENAVSVYGLDREKLSVIAGKIGPVLEQITAPLESVPRSESPEREGMGLCAFRTVGAWG
jgi:predicted TIM-barrel fold metal-dependent hydrolase